MQEVNGSPVEVSQSIPPTAVVNVTNTEKKSPAPINADEKGLLVGSTFEEQFRLARAYHASGLMPQGLNTPEKVLVAIQLCRELNLPPMSSIGKIMVINGTPAIFGDLPLALVMRSGLLESIKEEVTHDPGTHQVEGARCSVKRKGLHDWIERTFTMEDAKQAGLLNRGPWKQYTKRMLQMRARSWALKDAFADVLMCAPIAEYDFNATADESGNVVGENTGSVAEELNNKYANEEGPNKEQGGAQ